MVEVEEEEEDCVGRREGARDMYWRWQQRRRRVRRKEMRKEEIK